MKTLKFVFSNRKAGSDEDGSDGLSMAAKISIACIILALFLSVLTSVLLPMYKTTVRGTSDIIQKNNESIMNK